MKKTIFIITILICALTSCKQSTASYEASSIKETKKVFEEISFITKDSIKVYGDLYEKDKSAPTLLIFHQGGSNTRAEYKSIIPVLEKEGFNILTIDQRVGGQYFYGGYNRTVAEISKNEFHYCDAYPDMVSALEYIINKGFTGKKILWGSSYSATLALQLADENKDVIDGVLAFSPASGDAMKDCQPIPYIESLKLPLLLMKPTSEMQSERSQDQIKRAKENGHETYIAENGVHGSSMLDDNRVEGSTDDAWHIVKTFLSQFK
ncbi:alpha/beta fold hydrolase [uncultured Winogradskyella sp.]|uniref:alpha/beta fold hydrolase n=1 Tax=uncultured Winogradskyella sp. TaxID=395353 RepID=UPI00261B649F|nr:alpha/beta fold hydrolase [uncultured Winogradskyella sp.]